MAYTGFPATYQSPLYGAPAYAQAAYGGQGGIISPPQAQAQQAANYGPQTAMTPPTIHAEIIQVESEEAVDTHPQAAGTSQMYMTRAEDKIVIKTQYANGFDKIIYDKRPPAPPAPAFVPEDYVRKDEITKLVAAAVAALEKEDAI
jgi:hypothetical protein